VIVTTPQAVALTDAMKCLSFTQAVNLPVLGLVENMSGYVCPCCGEVSNVFSTGGGEAMAQRERLAFLGSLPVDTELVTLLDAAISDEVPSEVPSGAVVSKDSDQSQENQSSFSLLRRYKSTSSARLFEVILQKALVGLHSSES
jgi:hypothetical protein